MRSIHCRIGVSVSESESWVVSTIKSPWNRFGDWFLTLMMNVVGLVGGVRVETIDQSLPAIKLYFYIVLALHCTALPACKRSLKTKLLICDSRLAITWLSHAGSNSKCCTDCRSHASDGYYYRTSSTRTAWLYAYDLCVFKIFNVQWVIPWASCCTSSMRWDNG